MHFSGTPTTNRSHPPQLGEHTVDVLSEFGYSAEEIAQLEDHGVI